jgi:hypothetical protein
MTLIKRLEKLESSTAAQGSAFCLCIQNYFEAAISEMYGGAKSAKVTLPEGDFCEKCCKPVNPLDTRMMNDLIKTYGEYDSTTN